MSIKLFYILWDVWYLICVIWCKYINKLYFTLYYYIRLTWTVFHRREGFADIDVKAAWCNCICSYGDPRAVISVPDQVPQVVFIPMRIYRYKKGCKGSWSLSNVPHINKNYICSYQWSDSRQEQGCRQEQWRTQRGHRGPHAWAECSSPLAEISVSRGESLGHRQN